MLTSLIRSSLTTSPIFLISLAPSIQTPLLGSQTHAQLRGPPVLALHVVTSLVIVTVQPGNFSFILLFNCGRGHFLSAPTPAPSHAIPMLLTPTARSPTPVFPQVKMARVAGFFLVAPGEFLVFPAVLISLICLLQ